MKSWKTILIVNILVLSSSCSRQESVTKADGHNPPVIESLGFDTLYDELTGKDVTHSTPLNARKYIHTWSVGVKAFYSKNNPNDLLSNIPAVNFSATDIDGGPINVFTGVGRARGDDSSCAHIDLDKVGQSAGRYSIIFSYEKAGSSLFQQELGDKNKTRWCMVAKAIDSSGDSDRREWLVDVTLLYPELKFVHGATVWRNNDPIVTSAVGDSRLTLLQVDDLRAMFPYSDGKHYDNGLPAAKVLFKLFIENPYYLPFKISFPSRGGASLVYSYSKIMSDDPVIGNVPLVLGERGRTKTFFSKGINVVLENGNSITPEVGTELTFEIPARDVEKAPKRVAIEYLSDLVFEPTDYMPRYNGGGASLDVHRFELSADAFTVSYTPAIHPCLKQDVACWAKYVETMDRSLFYVRPAL